MDTNSRTPESSYAERRLAQEQAAAAATLDATARRVHLELAERYAAMLPPARA